MKRQYKYLMLNASYSERQLVEDTLNDYATLGYRICTFSISPDTSFIRCVMEKVIKENTVTRTEVGERRLEPGL